MACGASFVLWGFHALWGLIPESNPLAHGARQGGTNQAQGGLKVEGTTVLPSWQTPLGSPGCWLDWAFCRTLEHRRLSTCSYVGFQPIL